jgi:hypothetical protein
MRRAHSTQHLGRQLLQRGSITAVLVSLSILIVVSLRGRVAAGEAGPDDNGRLTDLDRDQPVHGVAFACAGR